MLAMSEEPKDGEEVTGRAKGGIARRDKLSPEQRSEIARKAAMARHKPSRESLPKAIREGVIKMGDLEIRCAVLEDGRRVLTQSDVMISLGRARQVKDRKSTRLNSSH